MPTKSYHILLNQYLNMSFQIYTDGGCSGNPGCGAWAFVIIDATNRSEIESKSGYCAMTTNNRMELQSVIEALSVVVQKYSVFPLTLFTDSQYVQKGITIWIHNWILNGWKSKNKTPIKNIDLWQSLYALQKNIAIEWQWLKGHAQHYFNEYCHTMVQKEINKN